MCCRKKVEKNIFYWEGKFNQQRDKNFSGFKYDYGKWFCKYCGGWI